MHISPLLVLKGKLRPRERLRHPKSHREQKQYESQKLIPLTNNLITRSHHSLLLINFAHSKFGYQNISRESNKDTVVGGAVLAGNSLTKAEMVAQGDPQLNRCCLTRLELDALNAQASAWSPVTLG